MSAQGRHFTPASVQRGQLLTVPVCKHVLVVASTMTYAKRMREISSLLRGDLRVQVSFTVPPHPFGEGTKAYLRCLGLPLLPWREAVRAPFDLAVAAGTRGTEQIKAPLLRLAHGAGHSKPLRTGVEVPGAEAPGRRPPGMLSRSRLMRGGRLLPASVALSHQRDLEALRQSCPEAVPVAEVVGDPSIDRLTAHAAGRNRFRRALGVSDDESLLLFSSTWGRTSFFGGLHALLPQLLKQLAAEGHRVAVLLHPNVWAAHGSWHVRSWLEECVRHGVALLPPETDWEALLLASDLLVGDHGSLTAYAASADVPVLLTHVPHREVVGGSPAALLASGAPSLTPLRPLREQVRYTVENFRPGQYRVVAEALTSVPGRFHQRMRALIYRMLGLGEPACPPPIPPLPDPPALEGVAWQGGWS